MTCVFEGDSYANQRYFECMMEWITLNQLTTSGNAFDRLRVKFDPLCMKSDTTK